MRRIWIAGMLLGVAACANQQVTRIDMGPAKLLPPADCQAAKYRDMIGKPVAALLPLDLPPVVRIYQAGGPVSEGVQDGRLDFEFDKSRTITAVHCG